MNTESMWDKINIAYANRNQPLMFGLATDDSHNYHEFGSSFANAGRGWVMVQSEKLDAPSLITAMEAGKFYASTGVSLKNLEFENSELKIEIATEKELSYSIDFIGVRKNELASQILKTISGSEGSFTVTEEFLFVRARVTSNRRQINPFQEGDFEMAWTQPVSSTKH
jgi:hypothetical protein